MNTRRFNQGANARLKAPNKRRKTGAYHDSIPVDDDDFATVSVREETVGSRKLVRVTERITQRSSTSWSSSDAWLPEDNTDFGLQQEDAWFDDEEELPQADSTITLGPDVPKKRSLVSVSAIFIILQLFPYNFLQKRPHVTWMTSHRDQYLDEMIRWDGRGDYYSNGISLCPDCVGRKSTSPGQADHRCRECYSPVLTCKACCIRRHRLEPFHWIEVCGFVTFSRPCH